MVVSAGNDGFARVFNPDNGEILGAVQLQQVRFVEFRGEFMLHSPNDKLATPASDRSIN